MKYSHALNIEKSWAEFTTVKWYLNFHTNYYKFRSCIKKEDLYHSGICIDAGKSVFEYAVIYRVKESIYSHNLNAQMLKLSIVCESGILIRASDPSKFFPEHIRIKLAPKNRFPSCFAERKSLKFKPNAQWKKNSTL
jgi:hypothetical protein